MRVNKDPREIAIQVMKRSTCSVQVGAVLVDKHGAYAWGWNHEGSGFGEHAEVMALKRANYKRVPGSVLWVAARRRKSGNVVSARPCAACWPAARICAYTCFRAKDGTWETLKGNG